MIMVVCKNLTNTVHGHQIFTPKRGKKELENILRWFLACLASKKRYKKYRGLIWEEIRERERERELGYKHFIRLISASVIKSVLFSVFEL